MHNEFTAIIEKSRRKGYKYALVTRENPVMDSES